MHIDDLLRAAVSAGASDLHLGVESPPAIRVRGELIRLDLAPLTPQVTRSLLEQIASPEHLDILRERGEVDFAYSLSGVGRFRVNAFRQRSSVGLAIRSIPFKVPRLDELGLPPVVEEFTGFGCGLVLVTGSTGSGKSTTLAAMIDLINSRDASHILTIEDPIEYLHKNKKSIVSQREIGGDTRDFAGALRAALRQDPDVILVGEMRDTETMATALMAAETGHLVLGTLHTGDAPGAVERLVGAFSPYQQGQIRQQLALVLVGVIVQQLVPKTDGGLVVAVEVLVGTPAARAMIREGKTHQLTSIIQTGGKFGMQTMEASLQSLLNRGLISEADFRSRLPILPGQVGGAGHA